MACPDRRLKRVDLPLVPQPRGFGGLRLAAGPDLDGKLLVEVQAGLAAFGPGDARADFQSASLQP